MCTTKHRIATAAAWALLASAFGCSHTIPASTPKPTPPPITSAPPSFTATGQPVAQPPEAQWPLAVKTDLRPIQRAIQASLPERFTDATHPLGRDYRWTFVRDGLPEVNIQDGLVTIRAPYRGEIEARELAQSCRLGPLYPVFEGGGQLQVRQDGSVLVFVMDQPRLTTVLKPESETKCNLFALPVKDQLRDLLDRDGLERQIAQAITPDTLRIPIAQVWQELQGPINLPSGSPAGSLCLYGKPSEIQIGSVSGTVEESTIKGAVRGKPMAAYEPDCAHPVPANHLQVKNGVPMAEDKPFRILGSMTVPYETINHDLQSKLFHQQIVTAGGDTLTVERALASDANGRMLLTVETSGDVNGTLYYWGTPYLGGDGTMVTVPDLQMANESKKALDGIKIGYWHSVDDKLRERIQSALETDMSQQVSKMKSSLSGRHKLGDLALNMALARQRSASAFSTPQALVANVVFEGTASAVGRFPGQSAEDRPEEMSSPAGMDAQTEPERIGPQ
jgi:hypothetical protein